MKMKYLTSSVILATAALSTASFAGTPEFFGYARMGAAGSNGEIVNPEASNDTNGQNIIKTAGSRYQQTGRLANEVMGVEFGLRQRFEADDSKWDTVMFVDNGYDGTGDTLKIAQAYAGGTGVLPGQDEAYVWGGKRFNGRNQIGLNDYFILVNDGNGGGFDNLDVGFAKYDIAFLAGGNGNNNRYVMTNQLHGMEIGPGELRLDANYGFYMGPETEQDQNDNIQLSASYKMNHSSGSNTLALRYSENTRRNAIDWGDYSSTSDVESVGIYDWGDYRFSDDFTIEYVLLHERNDFDGSKENWSQVVVRPQYAWTNFMTTWFELAYDQVEFEAQDATNSSYKATISQNFSIGKFWYSRPMVRFFASYGELDTEVNSEVGSTSKLGKSDALNLGIMFEAWW